MANTDKVVNEEHVASSKTVLVFQCQHCLSLYDAKAYPAEETRINHDFYQIPPEYKCTLCEAGAEDFKAVAESTLVPASYA